MIKKIFGALLVGFVTTIFFAQFDSWTHEKITHVITNSLQTCDCAATCTIQSINFFCPSVVLSTISIAPLCSKGSDDTDASWRWNCKRMTIESSWVKFLFQGKMDVAVVLEEFDGFSCVENNTVAIVSFIASLMQKAVIPGINISSVLFKKGHMRIENGAAEVAAQFSFHSSSFQAGNQFKTTMALDDGCVRYKEREYVKNSAIYITLITPMGPRADVSLKVNGTLQLPDLKDDDLCYITGAFEGGHGRFGLRSACNSLSIDPIIIAEKEIRVTANIPLSYIAHCLRNAHDDQVEGSVRVQIKIGTGDHNYGEGFCVVEDVVVNAHAVCDTGKIVFAQRDNAWNAKGVFTQRNLYAAQCVVDGVIDDRHGSVSGVGTITNTVSNVTHEVKVDCVHRAQDCQAHLSFDNHVCALGVGLDPHVYVKSCTYTDPDNHAIVLQHVPDTQNIRGTVSFALVRGLVARLFGYDVQGEGVLTVNGTIASNTLCADVELADATIRLPSLYNCIDGFKARFLCFPDERACICENLVLSLHTGTVSCPRAIVYLDPAWSVASVHAPLLLDHCLLNIKKDLFAIASGKLLCSKKLGGYPRVDGHLIIDRAQLKENLLSGSIQKKLFAQTQKAFSLPDVPVECDISIETTSPVRVDTPFLQTNAQVSLGICKEHSKDIAISGGINLLSGSLAFPYKPLHITKGTISFAPDQPFDPVVELVARNKIKKYDITLQVDGSLFSHNIMLSSTPPLSEEHIISLLLVGSEENLLNAMMPALIVQNVKNLIFSSNQSSFFNTYFKPLLRPFSVNLIPSFTDQTGRGGLRGALELSIEDRWRVIIQKNFTLTEDTRFELEYLVSDDIMLRAIRDERRDLAGEFEMRWKF